MALFLLAFVIYLAATGRLSAYIAIATGAQQSK